MKSKKLLIERRRFNLFLSFPGLFFLNTIKDQGVRTNLSKWRKMTNNGEIVGRGDIVSNSSEADKPPKGKGAKTRRVTRTCNVGYLDDTVQIKLAGDVSEYSHSTSRLKSVEPIESFGYDSYFRSQTCPSKIGNAESTFRVRALKRAASIGMSKGSTMHDPHAVMDTGAEREVAGGVGWKILHFSDKS